MTIHSWAGRFIHETLLLGAVIHVKAHCLIEMGSKVVHFAVLLCIGSFSKSAQISAISLAALWNWLDDFYSLKNC